ncbi:ribosomal protection-like ABC-F family protein [Paenibacillus elgii]|uniref:ribosomal protection-like ABC-F family protein n=1 Tax=Paenibacillus elgii TaxID=189691 RepID=UPI000248C73F|nr:ABC-F type ribosomal protection protein [Paenibacillus elgii]
MIRLEALQLEKSIGDRLLFAADQLRVAEQDRIGIVGRNGAGKTILLQVLAGRMEADQGTVSVSGTVGYIPQLQEDDAGKSGGELTSRSIEEALAGKPDLLFADEPTTNLDMEHIAWLERGFADFPGAIVIISHDRSFLDRVCSQIWELEGQRITVFKGNYSDYDAQKQLAKRQQQEKYEEYVTRKQELERAIALKKQKAVHMLKPPSHMGTSESRLWKMQKGTKQKGMHQSIKAIETRIDKLERVEKPRELPQVKMDIPDAAAFRSRAVLRVERLSASVGRRTLWKNASFQLKSGEKAALIGPNGSGKTTLIRKIIRAEEGVHLVPGLRIGYFSQNLDILRPEKSILDNVKATSDHPEQLIRSVLARLLFRQDDIYKRVDVLSGGERVKVAFAKVFCSPIHMLVMDEPTNYLDIDSIEALEQLLAAYPGTVLFVSHDRRFVRRIAGKMFEIRNESIVTFDGTYEEYEEHRQQKLTNSKKSPDLAEEELLRINMRLTELIGRLSVPVSNADKAKLEEEYDQLLRKRKELNKR